jgi:hypothetical protein
MARTEMIQASPSVALTQQSTPPSSPSLPSSEHVVTLSNVLEFIDMVKGIVAMQTASTLSPKCTCSDAPSGNAHPQTSTQPLTSQDLEQLILKLIDAKSKPPKSSEGAKPNVHPEAARASKLEFKTVNEVYVSNGIIELSLTIHLGGMRKILNMKSKNLQRQK